ncbi:MAG: DUF4397 domain-containing protein [Bacillota bacterium]
MDTNNYNDMVETSDDLLMPLPLTEEQIFLLDKEDLTVSSTDDMVRRLYPEINIVPNTTGVIIPIIPGITLYGYIRFFHAYPTTTAVDIYVNGKLIAKNILYRQFSEYYKAFPGFYRIAVYKAGERRTPILLTFINIIGYRIYTAAIVTGNIAAKLQLINDSLRPLPKTSSFIRFAQLSANAPKQMDAYLDHNLVLEGMEYQDVSRYLTTGIGKHNLKFMDYFNGTVLVEEPNVRTEGGKAYTAYVIGNVNDRTGLQIIFAEEGISYLSF